MDSCHSLLSCSDLDYVKIGKLLGVGGVKAVYHAQWKGLDVALSVLNNHKYESDFLSGMQNIKEFQQNPFTIQAIGFCFEEKMYLSEFHRNGDASTLEKVLRTKAQDGIHLRFKLCYNYVQILTSLHHARFTNGSSMPPKVLCDSNNLDKLLSQLLFTDDLSLVLNDMDALPTVGIGGIKCGHKPLKGNFVAPEQRWNSSEEYDDALMMGYDEKTDIWKVPSVCSHFLDSMKGREAVEDELKPIHEQCHHTNPKKRPTAFEILTYYENVRKLVEKISLMD
ncbi:hypothetical protein J437_LFUL017446 [Ladona fulva]|uniref:Protein kinase domain-containing protein n=1 Tax=Ladona fulva TaxID=123851 RepID=A0A8K0P8Y7_LADFU|nr:hypothetical protein J437_LFUL017446 [Ladona fulva]